MSIANVRLLVGDTDNADYVLQDTDIAFFLTSAGQDVWWAASLAAGAIAAKYARMVTNSQSDAHGVHTLTRQYSDRYEHYIELAEKLMAQRNSNAQQALSATGVYAGGISQSDKESRAADSDRPTSAFRRDLHTNEGGW